MAHVKVLLIAAVFGLLAYGVAHLLIYISRTAGLLDWLR
jgi:hypothetical protein